VSDSSGAPEQPARNQERSAEGGEQPVRGEPGAEQVPAAVAVPERHRRGLNRRTWTLITSFVVVAVLGLLGGFAQVPYVALGPGPTYDTLGSDRGNEVVHVSGQNTFPTGGHLTMTTVSLTDQVTLFGALGLWVSGRYALAPREEYFKPGESEQDVKKENVKAFQDSQSNAEVAALRYLGYPIKVLVAQIVSGSPADNTIAPGDKLVTVNGKAATDSDAVRAALQSTKPGDKVDVTFQHGTDQPRTAQIVLGRSSDRDWGFLGVSPVDRADVNFDVTISLADVGGPSAGLMFALAIVDKLTPGELNGGKSIAGTGEIDEKGDVKPIGGIPFKMVAAREAGATTFLVPADNCAEAKQHAPDGLQLVKVTKLADAVQELNDLNAGKPVPGC
jgi:PDZ domain-containing protein